MKFNNDNEVNEFLNVVDSCVGSVWLENVEGQKVDLKKDSKRFQIIKNMNNDADSDFELFAAAREDVCALLDFIRKAA